MILKKQLWSALVLTISLIVSCKESPELEKPRQIATIDADKKEIIKIPSSFYSDRDTVFLLEENQCYFRMTKKKPKHKYEPSIEGDISFAYSIKLDTLKFMTSIDMIEDKKGQLKTDTSICFYKIYRDSLVPIHHEGLTPIKGNKIYTRETGTYRRVIH